MSVMCCGGEVADVAAGRVVSGLAGCDLCVPS